MTCVGNLGEDGAYFTRILIGTAGTVQTAQPAPKCGEWLNPAVTTKEADASALKVGDIMTSNPMLVTHRAYRTPIAYS